MGKKVKVVIEMVKSYEKEIELPEGKTVDDIPMCCAKGKDGAEVYIDTDEDLVDTKTGEKVEGMKKMELLTSVDKVDCVEGIEYHTETRIFDLDSKKYANFS